MGRNAALGKVSDELRKCIARQFMAQTDPENPKKMKAPDYDEMAQAALFTAAAVLHARGQTVIAAAVADMAGGKIRIDGKVVKQ